MAKRRRHRRMRQNPDPVLFAGIGVAALVGYALYKRAAGPPPGGPGFTMTPAPSTPGWREMLLGTTTTILQNRTKKELAAQEENRRRIRAGELQQQVADRWNAQVNNFTSSVSQSVSQWFGGGGSPQATGDVPAGIFAKGTLR